MNGDEGDEEETEGKGGKGGLVPPGGKGSRRGTSELVPPDKTGEEDNPPRPARAMAASAAADASSA